MANYIRRNAWLNGGTFTGNSDLLWYAKGVRALQSRALNDPNSWWFFAAIHGQYVTEPAYPGWGFIPGTPSVPTSPLPSPADQSLYWDQCQHQSWFFPPWHRGYLLALEAQLRAAIIQLGGPSDWALPYWNYLGPDDEFRIPPAFNDLVLPDSSPNPLFVTARYGPNNDGDIFVPIPPVSQACLGNTLYTGSNATTPRPGFGGPQTGFNHGGGQSGNLESNPHNLVHVDVGGNSPDGRYWGLMSDPGIAALDPIFYLHHSNIDRLWAVWNGRGNANPGVPSWVRGPAGFGGRPFVMPMPGAQPWVFTPGMVDSLAKVNYTYDDLPVSAPVVAPAAHAEAAFASDAADQPAPRAFAPLPPMDTAGNSELLGAHDGSLKLGSSGVRASVRLAPAAQKSFRNVPLARLAAEAEAPAEHLYLQLENVRGTRDAQKLSVYVNDQLAGTVALFGLRRASTAEGGHGGSGLTLELGISHLLPVLAQAGQEGAAPLDVRIIPSQAVPEDADIRIGRVSLYRETH